MMQSVSYLDVKFQLGIEECHCYVKIASKNHIVSVNVLIKLLQL